MRKNLRTKLLSLVYSPWTLSYNHVASEGQIPPLTDGGEKRGEPLWRARKLLDTAEMHAIKAWGATTGRMKMIFCRDDLYDWYKRRGYDLDDSHHPTPQSLRPPV